MVNSDTLNVDQTIEHHKYINCLDIAPNGELAAIGDVDGQVKIFDLNN
jgi:WD40 repeat protein